MTSASALAGPEVLAGALDRAFVERDFDVLDAVLHRDLIYMHSTGVIDDRKTLGDKLRSGGLDYTRFDRWLLRETSQGATRVLVHELHVSVTVDTNTLELNLQPMTVWVETVEGWQLLAFHSLPKPKTP